MKRYLHAITVYFDDDGKTKLQVDEQPLSCRELAHVLELVVNECALKADSHGLTLFEDSKRIPNFGTSPHLS